MKVGDVVTDCDRVGLSKPRANEIEKAVKQGEINLQIIETQTDLLQFKSDKAAEAMKEAALYKEDDARERKEVDRLRGEGTVKLVIGFVAGVFSIFAAAKVSQSLLR